MTDRRVIVISVPGLTWADVDDPALPNLRALLDESAIANLATRVTGTVAGPAEAYLTFGSGTRAVAKPALGGLAYDADEPFGPGTVADEHARQQGTPVEGDVTTLSWILLDRANDDSEFGAGIGALGQALEDAGVGRGVVANADGTDPLLGGGTDAPGGCPRAGRRDGGGGLRVGGRRPARPGPGLALRGAPRRGSSARRGREVLDPALRRARGGIRPQTGGGLPAPSGDRAGRRRLGAALWRRPTAWSASCSSGSTPAGMRSW